MTAARQVPTIVFRLFVPGKPAAQGSKRHVGGGRLVEQSKAVAPWRTTVAWHAAQAYTQAPQDGPLTVGLVFVMPRPASTPKRSTPPAVKRPDLDKLQRAVFDALSGVIWRDDSQVTYVVAAKRLADLGEQPGVRIEVIAQDVRPTVQPSSVHGDEPGAAGAHGCTPETAQANSEPPASTEECARSDRADGRHSWRFDGDDPYIVCVYCDEMRDTITGRVIRAASS